MSGSSTMTDPTTVTPTAAEHETTVNSTSSGMSAVGDPVSTAAARHIKGTKATCHLCHTVGHRTERCVAHLLPHVIVATQTTKKHRFEEHMCTWIKQANKVAAEKKSADSSTTPTTSESWLPGTGLQVLPSVREPELIFLRTPEPQRIVQAIQQSPILNRHFDSIFTSQSTEATMEDVVKRVLEWTQQQMNQTTASNNSSSSTTSNNTPSFRLQAYPKSVRKEVLDRLVDAHVNLNPRAFTHVLFVVFTHKKYSVGIETRDSYVLPLHQFTPDDSSNAPAAATSTDSALIAASPAVLTKDEILSRAYHKLSESFLLDESLAARIQPGSRAIDIGASPGGWSAYLAQSKGCHVLAIDPGMVICNSPLIQHVPKLLQNSLAEIQAFVNPNTPLDLIVCDMNVRPEQSVELIQSVCSTASISPTARLILTCKETQRDRSKKLVGEAMIGLSDYWHNFRTYHLLANGRERTLICDYLDITPEARETIRADRTKAQLERQAAWTAVLDERKQQEAAGLRVSKRHQKAMKKQQESEAAEGKTNANIDRMQTEGTQ